MKTCPFCAEEVLDAAIKCKHCGSRLVKRDLTYVGAVFLVLLCAVGIGIYFWYEGEIVTIEDILMNRWK